MKYLKIYCDAGSYNNGYKDPEKPMIGSYGSIIVNENNEIIKEYSKSYSNITNNQGELYGFIKPYLEFLLSYNSNDKYTIEVISDSQYLVNGINKYLDGWKKKNWKNSQGDEVKNIKMWKIINFLINFQPNITLKFSWQKGHKGKKVTKEENPNIYFNEYCDSLAVKSINEALENNLNDNNRFAILIDTLYNKFNLN